MSLHSFFSYMAPQCLKLTMPCFLSFAEPRLKAAKGGGGGRQNRLVLRDSALTRLEGSKFSLGRLKDMQAGEIGSLVSNKADGQDIYLAIRMVPDLSIDAIVQVSQSAYFHEISFLPSR